MGVSVKSAKPLDRHEIANLTTRSARAWVRVRATVEENERLRAENAALLNAFPEYGATEAEGALRRAAPDLLIALEHLTGLFESLHANHAEWGDFKAARAAIAKARSAPLEQEVKP